ncbi:MAG: class II aldolase/adducin family protein [Leptospiraceae bacterium]|nr:class II aldolase/adducin family protein [Leptospiraceae bacterium]
MKDIEVFASICKKISSSPLWIQGPGGNVSVKMDDSKMIVKASGSELAEVNETKGYAYVSRNYFLDGWKKIKSSGKTVVESEVAYSSLVYLSNEDTKSYPRPSMELGFHAILDFKYVFHFHSLASLVACYYYTEKQSDILLEILKNDSDIFFEPFHMPGFRICEPMETISSSSLEKDSIIIFLANHGVILATNSTPFYFIENFQKWEEAFWDKNFEIPYKKMNERKFLYEFASLELVDGKELFPDSVILADRIKKVTNPGLEGGLKLKASYEIKDKGAADLFAIHSVIKRLVPDFPSLSQESIQELISLPTEIARKKLVDKK